MMACSRHPELDAQTNIPDKDPNGQISGPAQQEKASSRPAAATADNKEVL